MDLSLITSLYRSEAHLPHYMTRVRAVAAQVAGTGLVLQVVVVANDPTPAERAILDKFSAQLANAQVVRLEVPREPVYASWNRGIAASAGRCLAIWNVDDVRNAPALLEGVRRIEAGCDLVEFPFAVVQGRQTTQHPPQYQPEALGRKTRLGPFFVCSRELYNRAGPFDARFRISGDFEWCARPAVREARVCHGEAVAGSFFLHSGNLSGSHNSREDIEDAIVMLRHGLYHDLRPVDARWLRTVWLRWGEDDTALPPEIAAQMWGPDAMANWQRWQRQQARIRLERLLRAGPRWIIARAGLRPLLARWGVVKAETR